MLGEKNPEEIPYLKKNWISELNFHTWKKKKIEFAYFFNSVLLKSVKTSSVLMYLSKRNPNIKWQTTWYLAFIISFYIYKTLLLESSKIFRISTSARYEDVDAFAAPGIILRNVQRNHVLYTFKQNIHIMGGRGRMDGWKFIFDRSFGGDWRHPQRFSSRNLTHKKKKNCRFLYSSGTGEPTGRMFVSQNLPRVFSSAKRLQNFSCILSYT